MGKGSLGWEMGATIMEDAVQGIWSLLINLSPWWTAGVVSS